MNIEGPTHPKSVAVATSVVSEATTEVASVYLGEGGLTIEMSSEHWEATVVFPQSYGFRVLDEVDLTEFWSHCSLNQGWLFEVRSGGWKDLELTREHFFLAAVHGSVNTWWLDATNVCPCSPRRTPSSDRRLSLSDQLGDSGKPGNPMPVFGRLSAEASRCRVSVRKSPRMSHLNLVFTELKSILAPYAARLDAKKDGASELYLDTRHIQKNRKPLFFGAVQMKKSFVSFHLMPVYTHPELLDGLSPALKKRMQGKSCFNFTEVDPPLFDELAALTRAGYARYQAQGYV